MESLEEVRQAIDSLDKQLLILLAKRQSLVERAGQLKPQGDVSAVKAKDRVVAVLASRRKEAEKVGLSPEVAEKVWESMIEAFTQLEITVNQEGQ